MSDGDDSSGCNSIRTASACKQCTQLIFKLHTMHSALTLKQQVLVQCSCDTNFTVTCGSGNSIHQIYFTILNAGFMLLIHKIKMMKISWQLDECRYWQPATTKICIK